MGKKLYHFTAAQHLASILETKLLDLEGRDFVANPLKYPPNLAKMLDDQFSVTGRFLWFTEKSTYNSSNSDGDVDPTLKATKNEAGIIIDADEINVKKWHYVKKENKNNAAFMEVANINDKEAKAKGDDPYDWWVSREPVDLTKVNYQVFYTEDD